MGKCLVITGSPRNMGNSELAGRFVAWEAGYENVEIVRLWTKKILSCRACYRCLEGTCPLEDDYRDILESIIEAQAIVLSVPTYFFGPNASFKTFLDRGLQFYSLYEKLYGKKAVGIVLAGMKHGEGYTRLALDNMILRMGFENRGTSVLYGALPGELFKDDDNRSVLRELGKRLSDGAVRSDETIDKPFTCSECKFSYFHFTDGKKASCLICGSRFTISPDSGVTRRKGTGVLLHTRESHDEHREWLIGMRKKFMESRKELKKIVEEHARPGKVI